MALIGVCVAIVLGLAILRRWLAGDALICGLLSIGAFVFVAALVGSIHAAGEPPSDDGLVAGAIAAAVAWAPRLIARSRSGLGWPYGL